MVLGVLSIFFAVATNNEWVLRTWIIHGGDIQAIHEKSKVPFPAFAIIHAEKIETDTTLRVATLLSLRTSPMVIPKAFYSPFCKDLPESGFPDNETDDLGDKNKRWVIDAAKIKLARIMNITQRYYLERAAKTKKPSIRHQQIALRRHAEPLLGIAYF